jgi:hypothetical protein
MINQTTICNPISYGVWMSCIITTSSFLGRREELRLGLGRRALLRPGFWTTRRTEFISGTTSRRRRTEDNEQKTKKEIVSKKYQPINGDSLLISIRILIPNSTIHIFITIHNPPSQPPSYLPSTQHSITQYGTTQHTDKPTIR